MTYDLPSPVSLLRADHLLAVMFSYVGDHCCVANQDILADCSPGPCRKEEHRLTVPISLARDHHFAFQVDVLSNPLATTRRWHLIVGLKHATCR